MVFYYASIVREEYRHSLNVTKDDNADVNEGYMYLQGRAIPPQIDRHCGPLQMAPWKVY